MRLITNPRELLRLSAHEVLPRLPMHAVVSVPPAYDVTVVRPRLEGVGDVRRLVWDEGRFRQVRLSPSEALHRLVESPPTNPEEVLRVAHELGPFFGPPASSVEGIDDAWVESAIAQGMSSRSAHSTMRFVANFIAGGFDGVTVVDILAGVERVVSLARAVRVVIDNDLAGRPAVEGKKRHQVHHDDGGLEDAVRQLEAKLVIVMLDGSAGSRGPQLLAVPAREGLLAYAELGILQLLAERSYLRKCARPRCPRFFAQVDRRKRLYCPAEGDRVPCKDIHDAEVKETRRRASR